MDINFIQEEFKSFFKLKFDSSFTNEIKFYKSGTEYVLEIPIQKITPDEYNLIDSFFNKAGFKRIGRAESVNSNLHNRTNYSIIDFKHIQQENKSSTKLKLENLIRRLIKEESNSQS